MNEYGENTITCKQCGKTIIATFSLLAAGALTKD